MIFFTRELHEGYQDDSGWTRLAAMQYGRNFKLYKRYFRLIQPFLPASAIRFSTFGFHDCEIIERGWREQKLHVILDTAGAIMPLPKRYAHITFTGVRRCPARLPRKKEWWHSDEFHLGSRSKFCLHVMFTKTDVEIPADEIRLRFQHEKS
jgi:hypothetical protein